MSVRQNMLLGSAISALVGIAILTAALLFGASSMGTRKQTDSVGSVNLGVVPSNESTADEIPGLIIYNKSCAACHVTGAANAPRLGDKAAWEQRMARGLDQLLQTVMAGQGAMPPRGTCIDCSDEDLKIAIEYMLSSVDFEPAESTDAVSVLKGMTGEQGAAAAAQGAAKPRPDAVKGG